MGAADLRTQSLAGLASKGVPRLPVMDHDNFLPLRSISEKLRAKGRRESLYVFLFFFFFLESMLYLYNQSDSFGHFSPGWFQSWAEVGFSEGCRDV